jgi:hypothetical protein
MGFLRRLSGYAGLPNLCSALVPAPASLLKRLVLGRPFRSDTLGETLLPKRLALPIFASDPLSSFRKPKAANAAKTMVVMGAISIAMFIGVTALALIADVRVAEHTCDLVGFTGDCENDAQRTVIAQLAAAVFGGDHSVGFFFIQATTALILILAANTAYNGFPLLGSILAQDRFLPRQLQGR